MSPMIRFLLDENFNGKIMRGLHARQPDIDIIRVQDTELSGADDPAMLDMRQRKLIFCSHMTWIQ